MANIRKYISKKGVITYHVQIRLKGYKPLTFACDSYSEALKWANDMEKKLKRKRLKDTLESKV